MPELFEAHLDAGPPPLLRLRGELDLATAPLLRQALSRVLSGPHTRLVVDTTQLSFIDASGLSVLIVASLALPGGVRLRGASPTLRRLRTILELDTVLADEAEAGGPAPS